MPVVTYSFSIIYWTKPETRRLDNKDLTYTRLKKMTQTLLRSKQEIHGSMVVLFQNVLDCSVLWSDESFSDGIVIRSLKIIVP